MFLLDVKLDMFPTEQVQTPFSRETFLEKNTFPPDTGSANNLYRKAQLSYKDKKALLQLYGGGAIRPIGAGLERVA